MKREIDVLSTQVEKETKERDTIEKQLSNEDKLIQDLNIKLKYATTYFQSIQDNINIENRQFTEALDKYKKEKEETSHKQVHIQNTLSSKVIEQLEVRLRN